MPKRRAKWSDLPFLQSAVHVLQGRGASIATPPRFITLDSRRLGPVSLDEAIDLDARIRFWRDLDRDYSARHRTPERELSFEHEIHRDLAAHLGSDGEPIFLWAGDDWSERLFVWRVLERIHRSNDIDPARVRIVWLPSMRDPEHGPVDHAGGATLYRGPRVWALRGTEVAPL